MFKNSKQKEAVFSDEGFNNNYWNSFFQQDTASVIFQLCGYNGRIHTEVASNPESVTSKNTLLNWASVMAHCQSTMQWSVTTDL